LFMGSLNNIYVPIMLAEYSKRRPDLLNRIWVKYRNTIYVSVLSLLFLYLLCFDELLKLFVPDKEGQIEYVNLAIPYLIFFGIRSLFGVWPYMMRMYAELLKINLIMLILYVVGFLIIYILEVMSLKSVLLMKMIHQFVYLITILLLFRLASKKLRRV